LINGSFEDPIVPSSAFTFFEPGSTNITGWTVVGEARVTVLSTTFSVSPIVYNAQDGNQWLDLTGTFDVPSSQGVTQNISTMIGQPYNVEFYVGSARDVISSVFPSTVDLQIDSGPRESFFNPAEPTTSLDWKLFTKTFTATNSTTTLTFFNGNKTLNLLGALDNVSVTAVPGPLPLLGVGSAFLWSRRLRKRIKG
jgi:hypothetical protein